MSNAYKKCQNAKQNDHQRQGDVTLSLQYKTAMLVYSIVANMIQTTDTNICVSINNVLHIEPWCCTTSSALTPHPLLIDMDQSLCIITYMSRVKNIYRLLKQNCQN